MLCLCMAVGGCVGTAPTKEVHEVDSLNGAAYACRYKDLAESERAALRAYESARLYGQGKAEACNHLGFCAFMRMDFGQAERWHLQAYDWTKNEAELLAADVGLMKVYQRTAQNKEFYDYRNSALRRMKRIAEDDALFVDRHEQMRLCYARSEFYLVSAVYYHYLQQRPDALACIRALAEHGGLPADTCQLLYYHYVKGAASLCEGETPDAQRLAEFDELYGTWLLASRNGYRYFEGSGMQGLADLMSSADRYGFFLHNREHALRQFRLPADTLFPLRLGQAALEESRAYDDLYRIAGAYVSIGKYLNAHGRYGEALDTLKQALECVNDHHSRLHGTCDSLDRLEPFDERGGSVEKTWMGQRLATVPEWISRIREQLSVAYAGLGMREPSDYNRNIYLDILEDTRQDKELESRYQALGREAWQLNCLSLAVTAGFVVAAVFFWWFNKRSKARNRLHLHRIRQMLDICQQIMTSIPADAQSEEEIVAAIRAAVGTRVDRLFGMQGIRIEGRQLSLPPKADKDKLAMARVISPYIQWALENGMASVSLGDERRRLEKQVYLHEQHIADNKRKNLVKKTCFSIVSGIRPYIDRIANEVDKLRRGYRELGADIREEKYRYIGELVDTINEYNDILALWVKVKQGGLSLHVENFGLDGLFSLLQKGARAFEMKQQRLEVTPTDAWVKADKALTLFMINTLAENARKYTQPGGTIRVYAGQTDKYVEISVEDNGRGLSPEDVARIMGEKVYDSKVIGMKEADDPEALRRSKGSGFGLMNCKGIIEKYRKTNGLFDVCRFCVESTLGKGSRFYFRLPPGVRKPVGILFLVPWMASCSGGSTASADAVPDSPAVWEQEGYEALLDSASDYANAAYYCNVDGEFEWALAYIDSAMLCLNAHYGAYAARPQRYMRLCGTEAPAELDWWDEPFYSDFHVILDIRNEAAVAFLALKQWEAYSYNNAAYTALYKLLGEDRSLEKYCRELERSTTNKMVGILLAGMIFPALLLGYYVLYFRRRLSNRWNLEQVFEINRQVFAASLVSVPEERLPQEENLLEEIPQRIVETAFDSVNELLAINRLSIAVCGETVQKWVCASFPATMPPAGQDACPEALMRRCFEQQAYLSEKAVQALPLVVEMGGKHSCIGVLCLERREGTEQPQDRLLLELVTRYVALVVFNSVVRLSNKFHDIEMAQDEAQRAAWEDSVLHVQNMVLDNCLSTIKHETFYYPNKIRQLIGKLRTGGQTEAEERETVVAIGELIDYYKGIFTILSQCASRQMEDITFRRTAIPVGDLLEAAGKYFRKASKRCQQPVVLQVEKGSGTVSGDRHLLRFLLENLIDEALSVPRAGEVRLRTEELDGYVCFRFTDTRRNKPQDELDRLFYPSLARMEVGAKGELRGTEYLICKQIIREHDEYVGHRGCRMNATAEPGGGFTVYFTLPCVKNRESI